MIFQVFTKQKAPLKRRLIEYETMKKFDSLKPGSSPKPYCLDMEDNVSKSIKVSVAYMLQYNDNKLQSYIVRIEHKRYPFSSRINAK